MTQTHDGGGITPLRRLYHLTSIYHLATILQSGYLKTVESNIDLTPSHTHAGPDVVWLTTSTRPGQGWARMASGFGYVDKTRIIFEVAIPQDKVYRWWDWALEHGSDALYMNALAASGDEKTVDRDDVDYSPRAREEWWVTEREIPWLEWATIYDRLAGTVIWRNTDQQIRDGTLILPRLWATPRTHSRVSIQHEGEEEMRATHILTEGPGDGVMVQVGGPGVPDLILDARGLTGNESREEIDGMISAVPSADELARMTDAQVGSINAQVYHVDAAS